jgi:RND family efflux transporter MFP subunit
MDKVKIEFDATEEDLGSLAVGQKAKVHVRSYSDRTFEGDILRISPVLDPLTRMARVEVLIKNREHMLKPGMYAEAEITIGVIEDTIVIPRNSVLESTSLKQIGGERKVVKNYLVYVVNDSSRAEQRMIETVYVNHANVAVEAGIELGERLVISGQNNLRDGIAVMIPSESIEIDSDSGVGEEAQK